MPKGGHAMIETTGRTLAIRGQTLSFRADPFVVGPDAAVDFHSDGAAIIHDGTIVEVGDAATVLASYPGIPVEAYAGHLIMAGFVDCHVHYPQTEVIASYGAQLLEWLEKYTFPAEAKFSDPAYAASTAEIFLDECMRNGVTTSSVYCAVHPASADAFFCSSPETPDAHGGGEADDGPELPGQSERHR
jgi:guanine deaminase